ncbi:mercury(II) reductase [Streptomyces sp. B-S-A8]|uniref:Mercuric reductase n=1 Tax=Streptomyces solicavernae TaxID=3043614 RepID=A0ABT6RZS0_9ACTN|nr:mercury(II) reductase [Streptomyces sp. B-S-A8]MDI3389126.1 mercury(II) reductase [Streptomyces sp. B-S-A8]
MTWTESGIDLAVIGSGSAAFAAAIAATNQGRRVVMVERGTTGGTCVNVGCVPSKALLAAAETRHTAAAAGRFPGLAPADAPVDFGALICGKDALVAQLRTEKYTDLAADYGWENVHGIAAFTGTTDAPLLDIALGDGGCRRIEAAHYLIATGSAPWAPPVDGLKGTGYLTSTTAMELDTLPESMVVVGGNAVGLEQAQLFARLGTRVSVIEALDRLAPSEEPEVSAAIEEVFADEGITVHTGAALTAVRRDQHGYTVTARRDGARTELRAEQLLIATGRRPVTEGLNLDAVGVKTGIRGEVVVDEYQRTTNERIWAAGDVAGGPQFVYVAAAQGTLAADNALTGTERTLDYTALPRVTFTSPAIAAVGMTDAESAEAGIRCDCRALPLEFVPRALANRDTRGLVKLVAEAGTGRVLGVHVIADGAGDLITAATYAISAGMTVDQLAHTWAPYLTMAEALKLTAQTFTADVARLSCCAG